MASTSLQKDKLDVQNLFKGIQPLERDDNDTEYDINSLLSNDGPPFNDSTLGKRLLRRKILTQGIRSNNEGLSEDRIYVWLILLDAGPLATDEYVRLIHRGSSPVYDKIRNDTFRTLATDPLFRRRVSENSLVRVLNAVAWYMIELGTHKSSSNPPSLKTSAPLVSRPSTGSGSCSTEASDSLPSSMIVNVNVSSYVQGMNVLAAPFLYVAHSETQAFVALTALICKTIPAYVSYNLSGVHTGLALIEEILWLVDPQLASYLSDQSLTPKIYAFPSVLTLCACTPPLPELLVLWDFLFAYGCHLNLFCIVAQVYALRDALLRSPRPAHLLRSFPPLNSREIIALSLDFIKLVPDHLYARIVTHVSLT